jgi:hypothetical protein
MADGGAIINEPLKVDFGNSAVTFGTSQSSIPLAIKAWFVFQTAP